MASIISKEYISFIKSKFALDWKGVHGAKHWARVRLNGLTLAEINGADRELIEIFAFIHDVERWNDYEDPMHGPRAAILAEAINKDFWKLERSRLNQLIEACEGHSEGEISHPSMTVMTCWDADRLDLYRVGNMPNPKYLCTDAAKNYEIIEAAVMRSIGGRELPIYDWLKLQQ